MVVKNSLIKIRMSAAAAPALPYPGSVYFNQYYRNFPWLYSQKLEPGRFNLFFAFVHGQVKPGLTTFKVPLNSLVIQTGAKEAFGCVTMETIIKPLESLFERRALASTFSRFLGAGGNAPDPFFQALAFNTPDEDALNRQIYLTPGDVDKPSGMRFGIFRADYKGNEFKLKLEPVLTDYVRQSYDDGHPITTENLMNAIYATYPPIIDARIYPPDGPTNIVVFCTCTVAGMNANAGVYTSALNTAGATTHFGSVRAPNVRLRKGPNVTGHYKTPVDYGSPVGVFYSPTNLLKASGEAKGVSYENTDEAPLPAGWDMNYAGRTSRPYFFHRASGYTTFNDPREKMNPNFDPRKTYGAGPIGPRQVPPEPVESKGICDCITKFCTDCYIAFSGRGGTRRHRRRRRSVTRRRPVSR